MDISKELEALKLEREKLELEALREQVAAIRNKKDAQRRASEQQERDIKEAQRQQELQQKICLHRKGGTDLGGIMSGNSSDYSVIKHVMTNGDMLVMCTRCQKQWKKGDSDYAQAVAFPTDNQPSGSVVFMNTYPAK